MSRLRKDDFEKSRVQESFAALRLTKGLGGWSRWLRRPGCRWGWGCRCGRARLRGSRESLRMREYHCTASRVRIPMGWRRALRQFWRKRMVERRRGRVGAEDSG